jgi:two-component system KDP operon response regulator KdpE
VLHGAGFEVDATRTTAEALDRSAVRLPAGAIIELVLPDGDGVELCRRLREWGGMPVMVLSAVSDEWQQVRAFEAGADDYVTKPFRPRELVARLLANLRRADPRDEEPSVVIDSLEINLASREVLRDGEEIHLTPIEFELLRVLVQKRGRLLTHNSLLQQVWGPAYTDAHQALRAHIANLRRKIEPGDGRRLIHSEHGVGYRLADMHPEDPSRRRPAEEPVDGRFVRRCASTPQDRHSAELVGPAMRPTTSFSVRGLRVA